MDQEEKSPRYHVQSFEPAKIRQRGESQLCMCCACVAAGTQHSSSSLFLRRRASRAFTLYVPGTRLVFFLVSAE